MGKDFITIIERYFADDIKATENYDYDGFWNFNTSDGVSFYQVGEKEFVMDIYENGKMENLLFSGSYRSNEIDKVIRKIKEVKENIYEN